jgi:dihydroflavonol-4-reductase
MSNRRVCVIGATGFIGGAIARAAVEHGWRTRALRRRPGAVGALDDIADRIDWVPGAIEDAEALTAAMVGCDLVFHPAGYYITHHAPLDHHLKTAITQTRWVLDAFERSGAGRLVYTSSLTTVGPPSDPERLADERDPYVTGSELNSPYYECKNAMEVEVMEAAGRGLDLVVTNPTMTFGPGDVKAFTGRLLLYASRGLLFFNLPGVLNFTDVRDVAAGHLAAGEKLAAGERVILGGHNIAVPDAFRLICRVAGRRAPLFTVPRWLVEGIGRILARLPLFMLQDHMTTLHCWQPLNTTKMEEVLGIRPRPFEETVRDALEWYYERDYARRP